MNIYQYIAASLLVFMVAMTGDLLVPVEAFCSLTAEAELNYSGMTISDKTNTFSSNSITQRYSVLYNKSGKFVNGRFGMYKVSLGYEWIAYDANYASETTTSSGGNFRYSGEALINPKEMPFRLKVFSRDMTRSSLVTGSTIAESNGTSSLPSRITSGQHIESGATLIMGVKNGMTNGYNETLRHLPMLLLDYRDRVDKESNGPFKIDTRYTRLAFVSLNKKDNWFHYRFMTYHDYVDSDNNYQEYQVQLGTVDHLLQRRWVDFSNWLRVSADIQFTNRMQALSEKDFTESSLNIFAIATRSRWELRSFNSFTRTYRSDNDGLIYNATLPVYANGSLSPTSNWSVFTRYSDNHTDKGEYFKSAVGGYSINAFSKSPFTLKQGLSVESVFTSGGSESFILNGDIATRSTPLFSRKLLLDATYNIRNYLSSADTGTSNFIEQGLVGGIKYGIAHNVNMSVEQTIRLTSGTQKQISSTITGAQTNTAQYVNPRNLYSSNSSYQSVTNLSIAWTPKPRLNISFTASEDIYAPADGASSSLTNAGFNVAFSNDKIKIDSKSAFSSSSASDKNFSSANRLEYKFNRSLNTAVGFTYSRVLGAEQKGMISVDQTLKYTKYNSGGFSRVLFEINEMFSSGDQIIDTGGTRRSNLLVLGAKYYPLRQMMISGGARYSFVGRFEDELMDFYSSLSVQFRLLEASLDYTYGKNKNENRIEKKYSANIKKRF